MCVCVCVCVFVCVCVCACVRVCVFFTSAWLLLQYSFTSLRIYMLRSLYYCFTFKALQVSTTAPGVALVFGALFEQVFHISAGSLLAL